VGSVAAVVVACCLGGVAAADNALASSNPADGSTLAASPTSMQFVFTEPLGPTNSVVVTCEGEPIPVGNATTAADGLTLDVAVPNPLPSGSCTALVQVSAPDSSPNGQATITFTISGEPGEPAPTTPTVPATTPPSTGTAESTPTTLPSQTPPPAVDDTLPERVGGPLGLARVIGTLGLAVLLGSFVLIVVAWPDGVEYILTVRFLRSSWIVAILGSIGVVVFLTAQQTGRSVGASVSPSTWMDLMDTGDGRAALVRLLLAVACGWVVIRPEKLLEQATTFPSLLLPIGALATSGFTRSGGDLAIVGIAAGAVHAVSMGVWLGGIVLLSRVVLAGPGGDDLVHAVRSWRRIATPALVVVVLSGAVLTWRSAGGKLFDSSWGYVLLLKALAVGVVIMVGAATRQYVRDRLARVDQLSSAASSSLKRATGMEALGGIVALVLSSWLVSMPAPGIKVDTVRLEYGYTDGQFSNGDLELEVFITGVVGRNGVRVEVTSPTEGLSGLQLRFVAPAAANVASVVLSLPELTGTGIAVLPVTVGVPLDAPGVWTLEVSATTEEGTRSLTRNFELVADDPVVPAV
jgi:copper transport protein